MFGGSCCYRRSKITPKFTPKPKNYAQIYAQKTVYPNAKQYDLVKCRLIARFVFKTIQAKKYYKTNKSVQIFNKSERFYLAHRKGLEPPTLRTGSYHPTPANALFSMLS